MKRSIVHVGLIASALALSACGAADTSPSETAAEPEGTVAPQDGDSEEAGTDGVDVDAEYDGPLSTLPTSFPEPEPADRTIAWLSPLGANETVNNFMLSIEGEVERLGGTLLPYDSEGDPDQQVTQMQQAISQGVDAIIVFPNDANALGPALEQADTAGIPVVAIEADPTGQEVGQYDAQILQGRDYHAFVHAREMARIHPGGKVAVVGFAVPVPSLEEYVERTVEYAEHFGLEVVAQVDNPTDDEAGSEQVMNGVLASNPDLDGVLAYNDASAIGATIAARSAGVELTTFGLNGDSVGYQGVSSGRQDLTLRFPVLQWSQELVAAAYALAADPQADIPETVFAAFPEILTDENIDEYQPISDEIAETYGS
jgi:ribose transport system substrate-binding protein